MPERLMNGIKATHATSSFQRWGLTMKNLTGVTIGIASLLMIAGCGGGETQKDSQSDATPAEIAAKLDEGPRAIEVMTLDSAKAELGAPVFDVKICSDCHTLGDADIAPDLLGVLDRRTLPWLMKQITDPAWMNEHDPITKALIEEFDMEMAGPAVTDSEAENILHYLLRESGKTVE